MDCSQHSPSRIKPHRGQITEDCGQSSVRECWRVFHEHVSRSNFANDSAHFAPQPTSLSIETLAGSGNADVLARKSTRYHINKSTPGSPIKGSDIIPNWKRLKHSVVLSRQQYVSGVLVSLNGANTAPSREDAAKYSSTSAREKCQLIESFH
jgi:hypothetical protein